MRQQLMGSKFMGFVGVAIAIASLVTMAAAANAADQPLKSGIDRSTFDTSVMPGDDFFEYVNGKWIKENPIPAEYSRWARSRSCTTIILRRCGELWRGSLRAISRWMPARAELRDFYQTAMDEKKLNEQGAKPLAGEFKRIAKINSPDDLIALVGHFQVSGISGLFGFGVEQDEKQSSRYAVQLWQGGLGLPDRDYYLGTSDDSKRIRDQYHEHIEKMLTLLGDSPEAAKAGADAVCASKHNWPRLRASPVQLRDREAQYNKLTIAELAELTPNLNWKLLWDCGKCPGGGRRDCRPAGVFQGSQRNVDHSAIERLANLFALAFDSFGRRRI